jgi:hypothetical protein
MIVEVMKSQDLTSARWRGRKAGGVIQPESEGLRTRFFDVSTQVRCPRIGEDMS